MFKSLRIQEIWVQLETIGTPSTQFRYKEHNNLNKMSMIKMPESNKIQIKDKELLVNHKKNFTDLEQC